MRQEQQRASGYLLKDCASDELAEAVRAVSSNRTYLSPAVHDVVIQDYAERVPSSATSASTLLTAHEREVLQMVAEGRSTKEIAAGMHVSVKTVDSHRRNTMQKLDIHSVAGLTKYAAREGLTSIDA